MLLLFLSRSIFTWSDVFGYFCQPISCWGSSKMREAMTGGGEMDWGWVCSFFRVFLREEGRNSVVLVGLTAEHAHTLSSIWFLPNEYQTPLVKSVGHGGKQYLCKSPPSPFIHSQTAERCCLVPSDWKLKSSLIPQPPPFSLLSLTLLYFCLCTEDFWRRPRPQ